MLQTKSPLGPFHTTSKEFENRDFTFCAGRTQQSWGISDSCLTTTRSGKSFDYRDIIVYEKLCFHVFSPHENKKPTFSNSSSLKNVFHGVFQKLFVPKSSCSCSCSDKFRRSTVDLTAGVKLCFRISAGRCKRGLQP